MTRRKRKIIHIDQDKCDGCGLCVEACHEGAIELVDGKARLVSDIYCDGLGDCLGECPQGAITIEERMAEPFDEEAVRSRGSGRHSSGCPGSRPCALDRPDDGEGDEAAHTSRTSRLTNWPVQLKLLPVHAPYLSGARLLVCADCVPFSFADFHERFVRDRVVLVGCPKLDDAALYVEKLAEIFRIHDIRDVEVAYMEVPCCTGMVRIVESALASSNRDIPFRATRVGIRGDILSSKSMETVSEPTREQGGHQADGGACHG